MGGYSYNIKLLMRIYLEYITSSIQCGLYKSACLVLGLNKYRNYKDKFGKFIDVHKITKTIEKFKKYLIDISFSNIINKTLYKYLNKFYDYSNIIVDSKEEPPILGDVSRDIASATGAIKAGHPIWVACGIYLASFKPQGQFKQATQFGWRVTFILPAPQGQFMFVFE